MAEIFRTFAVSLNIQFKSLCYSCNHVFAKPPEFDRGIILTFGLFVFHIVFLFSKNYGLCTSFCFTPNNDIILFGVGSGGLMPLPFAITFATSVDSHLKYRQMLTRRIVLAISVWPMGGRRLCLKLAYRINSRRGRTMLERKVLVLTYREGFTSCIIDGWFTN